MVSEELFPKILRNTSAQWSLNFLGGKPIRCDGIRVCLRLLDAETSKSADLTTNKPIELTIGKKKKAKTAANIKRTPFEEDNYIASAWCRPFEMPLPSGPRCLRVLGPMSDMEITNLSKSVSGGNAIEGAVNRICLKLQAGGEETCSDIKYTIKCSTLVTIDGTTKSLTTDTNPGENEIYVKGPDVRAPVLVTRKPRAEAADKTDYCYPLPAGWDLSGSGQESPVDIRPTSTSLVGGESTYLCFELFRPLAISAAHSTGVEEAVPTASICQTDFEVSVSYRQERENVHTCLAEGPHEEMSKRITENVMQKFSGSVVWAAPIRATFDCQTRSSLPCGSRHPSNLTDEARPSDTSIFTNIPMVDGERISIGSTLQRNTNVDDIALEIVEVRFENDEDAPCRLTLSSDGTSDQAANLYRAAMDDPSRWLTKMSNFSFVYSVHAEMTNTKRSITFPLGNISVDWLPKQIDLPEEARAVLGPEIQAHGPLVSPSPLPVRFKGPLCYIEKAPFKTAFQCRPPVPKVSVPFEVHYSITNDTETHQRLVVALDSGSEFSPGQQIQDILVCGSLGGTIRLAAFETIVLTYSAIATKPGMTTLPAVNVSSARFNAWIVHERGGNSRHLCVLP